MSRTGTWVLAQQWENENWSPHEGAYMDYSPHDYATAQPEWNAVFGECVGLLFQALTEQGGGETPARILYSKAENLAVDVIACKREKTLAEAYRELGYDMDTEPSNELPF